jgi:S1-C subfamily serine protease
MEHLEALSNELTELAHRVAPWVVRVNGRRGPNATGVLWSSNTVITSDRAVHRDAQVEIGLADGRVVLAKVTGRAPDMDFVTLELEEPVVGLQPLRWADKVSPGLMMALARDRHGALLTQIGLLPTETLVHRLHPAPEFLGSPLVDRNGGFLGIHLLVGPPTVVAYKQLAELVEKLASGEFIEPAFLGLGLHRVDSEDGPSCLVVKVEGPAAAAGLLIGDIILSIDDQKVNDPEQVREVIRTRPAGGELQVVLLRGGKRTELCVTLGSRPAANFPGAIKRHVRRVMRHLHRHHHGPHHHGPPHHHHGPPPPPPEEPEIC